MKVTEVRIRLANEEFVKAYASICFDGCFLVHDIRVIKGPTGLFISFPNRTASEGGQRDIAFPVNAETRNIIEKAILAEYEKVRTSEPTRNSKQLSSLVESYPDG